MVIPNYESPPPIVTEVPELEPAPEPQAPAVERPQAPQPEQLADADRLPPPPLYQCNTWDNQNYLSEDADPKPRCVQLQTTGLAGDHNRAGGQACDMKYDLCPSWPDEYACDGRKQQQRANSYTRRSHPGHRTRHAAQR